MTRAASSSSSSSDDGQHEQHCEATTQTPKLQLSNRILHQQISDAGSMLSSIKQNGSCIAHKYHSNSIITSTNANTNSDMDNDHGSGIAGYLSFAVTSSAAPTPTPSRSLTEYPMDNETLEEINEMMEYLDASYKNASQMIQELLEARGEFIHHDNHNGNSNSNDYNYNGNGIHHPLESTAKLINFLFFDQDDDTVSGASDVDIDDDYSDTNSNTNSDNNAEQQQQQQTQKNANTTNTPKQTSTQIQKQQEEILQQEISEMASRLKQSSLGINSTLTAQNIDLFEMEELARDNLDKTKNITEKVNRQVRAGWRRSFGKWMAFFFVMVSWSFCFLTIRVVPKRKGKGKGNGNVNGDKKQKQKQKNTHEEYGNQGDTTNTKSKHVDPKYSYCEDSQSQSQSKKDNQKQCTAPLDPHYHSQHMDMFGNMNADQIAQMLAEEKRNQRMEMNRHKAKSEDERIASMRVRDGWDSRRHGNTNDDDDDHDHVDDDADDHVDDDVDDDDDDQIQAEAVNKADEFDDDDYYHNVGHDDDNDDYYTNDEDREADNTRVDDLHDTARTVYTIGDLKNAIHSSEILLLEKILKQNPALVRQRDENGWEAIHEAARGGNVDVVRILLDEGGADVDAQVGRTGQGGSTLWLTKIMHDASHPLVLYLVERGAHEIGPNRRDEL
jgi:hypothetical protein